MLVALPRCSDLPAHCPGAHRSVARRATLAGVAREITQRGLRNDSGEIMRELNRGKSFVVTRSGVPVGELVPLRRHRFIAADAAVALFRDAPPVDYDTFRKNLDEHTDQDAMPRG